MIALELKSDLFYILGHSEGRGQRMTKRDYLGHFEQMVLFALIRLGSNAYGVTIRQVIESRTGRTTAIGAVYATLERLEQKGFVSSRWGEPSPERGGRAKRFYSIRAPGQRALREALAATDAMAEGVREALASSMAWGWRHV